MASIQKTATTVLYAALLCAAGCLIACANSGRSFDQAESTEHWRIVGNLWRIERTDTYDPKLDDLSKRINREPVSLLSLARIQEDLADARASARNWLLSFWGFAGLAAAMMIVLAIAEQKRSAAPKPEPLEQRYIAAPRPLSITEPPLSAPPPPKPIIPVAVPPGARPPLPPQSFEAMLESTVGRLPGFGERAGGKTGYLT